MSGRLLLYIITCGPFVLTLAAWIRLYWAPRNQRHALALLALCIASTNAALACGTFLYYELRPLSHFLPSWQDPGNPQPWLSVSARSHRNGSRRGCWHLWCAEVADRHCGDGVAPVVHRRHYGWQLGLNFANCRAERGLTRWDRIWIAGSENIGWSSQRIRASTVHVFIAPPAVSRWCPA